MCDAPVVGLHAPRQELLSPVPAGPWSEGSCGCPALCQPQFLGEATRLWHAGMGLAATQWLKSPHVLEGDETLAQDAQRVWYWSQVLESPPWRWSKDTWRWSWAPCSGWPNGANHTDPETAADLSHSVYHSHNKWGWPGGVQCLWSQGCAQGHPPAHR